MTHDVYIQNNTGATLSLNLMNFFTAVDGSQVVNLPDGAEHTCQAECDESSTDMKFREYCGDNSITFGKAGLWVLVSVIEPVVE